MRKLYSDRRDFFIEQFNKLLSDHFILEVPEAGLHFVAWLRQENRSTVRHAGLRGNGIRLRRRRRSMLRESGAGSCAHVRLRRLVSGQIREGLIKFASAL